MPGQNYSCLREWGFIPKLECFDASSNNDRHFLNVCLSKFNLTFIRNPFPAVTGPQLQNIISRTQRVILHEMLHNSGVHFPEDVAENEALTENIFMMVS